MSLVNERFFDLAAGDATMKKQLNRAAFVGKDVSMIRRKFKAVLGRCQRRVQEFLRLQKQACIDDNRDQRS